MRMMGFIQHWTNPTCVKRLSSSPNTSFISVPRKWWMQLVKSNSAFGSFGRPSRIWVIPSMMISSQFPSSTDSSSTVMVENRSESLSSAADSTTPRRQLWAHTNT